LGESLDALTTEDVAGATAAGCVHDKLNAVYNAYNDFFTNPPTNGTQRVDVQLRNFVNNRLGKTFSAAEIERGLQLYLNRR
jgi:hypothetical protein